MALPKMVNMGSARAAAEKQHQEHRREQLKDHHLALLASKWLSTIAHHLELGDAGR
jgi:hypothetical protein